MIGKLFKVDVEASEEVVDIDVFVIGRLGPPGPAGAGADLTLIPGYDATHLQMLINDNGTIRWNDV